MARPKKDGLEYFPHDVHASNDKKVEALRMLYGNDGYAFFFILLETIYQEANFELDISDAETIQILCRKTELTIDRFNMMLETAMKRECFDREAYEERGVLTSNGVKKRADVVVKKRVKMQESYKEKVSATETREETIQKSGVSAPKVKESKRKVKEIINKVPYSENVNLLETEYQRLNAEFGEEVTKKAIDFLTSYKIEKDYKTKCDNRTLRRWVIEKIQTDMSKVKPFLKGGEEYGRNGERNTGSVIPSTGEQQKSLTDRFARRA